MTLNCVLEVGHLKSYEAEAIQLRGVTHELQKALRSSAREMEHLKVREKILEEEIRGLKKSPVSRQVGSLCLCVCVCLYLVAVSRQLQLGE